MKFANSSTTDNLLVPYLVLKIIHNKTCVDWEGLEDRIFQTTGDVITHDHPLLKQYIVVENDHKDDRIVAYFKPEFVERAVILCVALGDVIYELAKCEHIDARLLTLLHDATLFTSQIELAERELKEAEVGTVAFALKFRAMVLHTLFDAIKVRGEFSEIIGGILNDVSIDSSEWQL